MTRPGRVAALAGLAAIRREAAMAALHRAGQARDAAQAAIDALDARRAEARAACLADPSAALACQAERFEAWASAERGRLNLALARATAAWMETRDAAARAHGQREVLDRLAAQAKAEARVALQRRKLAEAPPEPARP